MQNSKKRLTGAKVKNNLRRIILIIVLIALVIVGGIYFKNKYDEKKKNEKDKIENYIPTTSVKIKLLNGCGYPGVAKIAKNYLINNYQKVYVISWKNIRYNKFNFDKSVIVVKKYDEKKLKYLQKITGIKRRIYAFNKSGLEEFHIIIGQDYKKYFSEKENYGH